MLNSLMLLMGGGVSLTSTFLASYGGSGADRFYGPAIDSLGNTILVGISSSTGVIGTTDGIVVKLGPDGTFKWARTYGFAAKDTNFNDVAVDSSDNIYVCGNSDEPGYGSRDCIVLKLSGTDGSITWQRELGGAGSDQFFSVDVSSGGNVACTGVGNGDIITAMWNSSGTLQWQRTLAASGTNEKGNQVCFDASGNVYIAGQVATSNVAVVAKYNSSGTLQWKSQLTLSTNVTRAIGIDVDSSNNPHVLVTNQDTSEVTVVKLNSTASTITWQRDFNAATGDATPPYGALKLDASGNVYSVFAATITTLAAIVACHNSSGTIQYQNRIRDDNVTDAISGYGLALDETRQYMAVACLTSAIGAGSTDGLVMHAPMAGTGTGTRNTIEYEAAGLTEAAGGLSIASSSATDAAGSLTSGTSALSTNTLSLTLTVS